MVATIGIDVGGTTIRAGVADGDVVLDREERPTPASRTLLEDAIVDIVRVLRARRPDAAAVGLAVAGLLDRDCRAVRFAPHLPWRARAVVDALGPRIGLPLVAEQDANAALWGEWRYGAAAGVRSVAMVLAGTGIGAAVLVDGVLFRGHRGVAPELGHLCVVPDGRRCACGKTGCLERYCSGTALPATALELVSRSPDLRGPLAAALRRDPDAVTGRRVMAAARAGDRLAVAAVADLAAWLGHGLAVMVDLFDPELVVVGGGLAESAALFLDDARGHAVRRITGAAHRPPLRLRAASLGADAGLIGAADLAARTPSTVPPGGSAAR